jgi:hypothetical protein
MRPDATRQITVIRLPDRESAALWPNESSGTQ